jgi:hypothetical protein
LWSLALATSIPPALAVTLPGAIPANFRVGDQGDARYTIPIVAPAATGGLTPNIALSYNHLAGDGLAGMRWQLAGLSVITRCQQTYAQDTQVIAVNYGSTDRFCLDGQRLVEFAGAYGVSGTQYRTEIESFQRVFQEGIVGGGPQSFYVQHGNGSTSYYGYTPDSRVERVGSSAVRLWYLSYTVDQFGNQINYTYDENTTSGEVFPTEITWTTNTGQGLSPRYKIVITPETRPSGGVVDDQRSGYDSGGALWASTKRIDKIDVIYNSTGTSIDPTGSPGRAQQSRLFTAWGRAPSAASRRMSQETGSPRSCGSGRRSVPTSTIPRCPTWSRRSRMVLATRSTWHTSRFRTTAATPSIRRIRRPLPTFASTAARGTS